MSVVITHPEQGIYLGNCMGLGFWSMLDSVGQICAATFESAGQAATHVESWDNHDALTKYQFVPVSPSEGGVATIPDLKSAGLNQLLGDMEANQ